MTSATVDTRDGTAAVAALAMLAHAGVDTMFGNPGTTELPLIRELERDARLRYVLTLHEGTAVSAAAGHALATGRPGVALLHAMPGLGNGLSMIYNAWRSRVPLVVIVGTQDRRHQYLEPILQADLDAVARPVSKRAWEVRTAAEIPAVLSRALSDAAAHPAGPVIVSVPLDLWDERVAWNGSAGTVTAPPLGAAPSDELGRLADLLLSAEAPVLVAGDLVGVRRAGDALTAVAELAGAATYWSPSPSLAATPTGSRSHRGPIFPDGRSYRRAFLGTDRIVAVGTGIPSTILFEGDSPFEPHVRSAVLTEPPGEPIGVLNPELVVHGAIRTSLEALGALLEERLDADPELSASVAARRSANAEAGATARARLRRSPRPGSDDGAPTARDAIAAALGAVPAGGIVVDEGVSNAGWISLLGDFADPLSYLALARGGSLGYSLGLAIGAHLATRRPVLVVVGDGALMYASQGLWTMAHEQLPIVTCVLNNSGYEILREFARSEHFSAGTREDPGLTSRTLDINSPAVDNVALAHACGVGAERVRTADECGRLVAEAFASGDPRLIDVPVAAGRST